MLEKLKREVKKINEQRVVRYFKTGKRGYGLVSNKNLEVY